MTSFYLQLTLLSDSTFGRGDGVAGLVDEEVEHDASTGLPYLRGRQLKGLLVEECSNILYALKENASAYALMHMSAQALFGTSGSSLDTAAQMRVSNATLPAPLIAAIKQDIETQVNLEPADVLATLTAIRRQTAMSETHGIPEDGSLRSMRVLLHGLTLTAKLDFASEPTSEALALLAACAAALRRAGTGRNRGRGRLRTRLFDAQGGDVTDRYLDHFAAYSQGESA